MKTKLLTILPLLLLISCCQPDAPYEEILKNDNLIKFTTRTFVNFVESCYCPEEAQEIYDIIENYDTFSEIEEHMKIYCVQGFKKMYIDRFLYIDFQWINKWKEIYDKSTIYEPDTEGYLTGIMLIIKKGISNDQ